MPNDARSAAPAGVTLRDATRVWARVGLNSFGGPAGQIAVMHRILVEEKRWISERRFLHALNYCMLLPGPEATQLATYVGWLMHRTLGGVVAGALFILPGFVAILGLSLLYAGLGDAAPVRALFFGLAPAVLAIVLQALIRIGRRALRNGLMLGIAAGAFVAIFLFEVPFPLIILGAAGIGLIGGRIRPSLFAPPAAASDGTSDGSLLGEDVPAHARASGARTARTIALWIAVWFVPVGVMVALLGLESVYVQEALFFSKAAVVTFGGAYAVLAYIAQQAVEVYGWLEPGEMLHGLGMAETTPGPLIQVVQFVGFMGAFREAGALHPLAAGALASVVVTWVTFVPTFLFVFAGAPHMERLRGSRVLTSALGAITAAVVGVILNLATWFSINVLFDDVGEARGLGMRLLVPRLETLDWRALAVTMLACALVFWQDWGVMRTLGVSVLVGITLYFL